VGTPQNIGFYRKEDREVLIGLSQRARRALAFSSLPALQYVRVLVFSLYVFTFAKWSTKNSGHVWPFAPYRPVKLSKDVFS
jgi:hypothetical protein